MMNYDVDRVMIRSANRPTATTTKMKTTNQIHCGMRKKIFFPLSITATKKNFYNHRVDDAFHFWVEKLNFFCSMNLKKMTKEEYFHHQHEFFGPFIVDVYKQLKL